jgi:triacylglycerol lipase
VPGNQRIERSGAMKKTHVIAGCMLLTTFFCTPPPPLLPDAPAHLKHSVDFSEILSYALMAHFAYQPDSVIEKFYRNYTVSTGILPSEKVNYFILTDTKNGIQYLAIQGTKYFRNIVLDMETSAPSDSVIGARLHKGFGKTARELYGELETKKLLNPDMPVCITGHSLGGAAGLICALYLAKAGYTIRKVITFGQPRITDADGARMFERIPLLRVVNSKDIIPFLPPDKENGISPNKNYIHFGPEVVLLNDKYFSFRERPALHNEADLSAQQDLTGYHMKEHHLRYYLSNIVMKLSKQHQVMLED